MTTHVVVIGDALLDRDIEGVAERLAPDAPVPVVDVEREHVRPGGAALAAVLAAHGGARVTLVTALAADAAAAELRRLLDAHDIEVVDVGLTGATPEKVRLCAGARPIARFDRAPNAGVVGDINATKRRAPLGECDAVLVSDYGRGMASNVRNALAEIVGMRPVVWDPHLNGAEPAPGTRLVTPNQRELFARAPADGNATFLRAVWHAARTLAQRWDVAAVAATLGDRGAMLVQGDEAPLVVPAATVSAVDTCGAGDCFAAAAAVALAGGALTSEAIAEAVEAATSFVGNGAARAFARDDCASLVPPGGGASTRNAAEIAARVGASGGVVVATGGCFDLLHAGHIATLQAARQLGDCLVVLLNSDASVRRLKGEGRPLQSAAERAAVLSALECVDAVEIFDDDTPVARLRELRPDVFAKGGDYTVDGLPEADVLATWGGQTVVLPYLAGRSTSALVAQAHQARSLARANTHAKEIDR